MVTSWAGPPLAASQVVRLVLGRNRQNHMEFLLVAVSE